MLQEAHLFYVTLAQGCCVRVGSEPCSQTQITAGLPSPTQLQGVCLLPLAASFTPQGPLFQAVGGLRDNCQFYQSMFFF